MEKQPPEPEMERGEMADANLRLAQRFLEDGDTRNGRNWLDKVVSEYGDTEAGRQAAALLEGL